MNWKTPKSKPPNKSVVWVMLEHPKRIYPQSYSIMAGQVCYRPDNHSEWRVEQNDENGCGSCYWQNDEILAWCYHDEFAEVGAFIRHQQGQIPREQAAQDLLKHALSQLRKARYEIDEFTEAIHALRCASNLQEQASAIQQLFDLIPADDDLFYQPDPMDVAKEARLREEGLID
jgi:hypothetical protein